MSNDHATASRYSTQLVLTQRGVAGHLWQAVCGPGGGCVELRRHPVRAAVRQPAFRRREHPQPIQKDQGGSTSDSASLACVCDAPSEDLSEW
jgi:hypothetical protein